MLMTMSFLPLSHAQTTNQKLDDIKFYADVIANAGNPLHRERANKEFSALLDEWINSESYNLDDLTSIQWLSVKQPEDSTFTLVTWQLEMDTDNNKYFGYLIKDEDRYRAAFAMQIANLLVRAMFCSRLGLSNLPEDVAYFSTVDVDRVMRKDPLSDCQTPSNPQGLLNGFGIDKGEPLTIDDIIKLTGSNSLG